MFTLFCRLDKHFELNAWNVLASSNDIITVTLAESTSQGSFGQFNWTIYVYSYNLTLYRQIVNEWKLQYNFSTITFYTQFIYRGGASGGHWWWVPVWRGSNWWDLHWYR